MPKVLSMQREYFDEDNLRDSVMFLSRLKLVHRCGELLRHADKKKSDRDLREL